MDAKFWNDKYNNDNFPWDLGEISPAIEHYMQNSGFEHSMRILIPGAGHAHEAEFLHKLGFDQVYVCDWAKKALDDFSERCPSFPVEHLISADFFKLKGHFDLMIEQTFFCALPRNLRKAYAQKTKELLSPKGTMAGLLFGIEFEKAGPPFGGTKEEYLALFEPLFKVHQMEITSMSVQPRLGTELFVELST